MIAPEIIAVLPPLRSTSLVPASLLMYQQNMRWKMHVDTILANTRRAAALVARVVLPTRMLPSAARALVLAIVLPRATFGWPFWYPGRFRASPGPERRQTSSPVFFKALMSIICAPLRRALHLPLSTSRLSILSEFGILEPRLLWQLSAERFINRAVKLPIGHLTRDLVGRCTHEGAMRDGRPAWALQLCWSRQLTQNQFAAAASRVADDETLKTAALRRHYRLWRSKRHTRDLVALRPDNDKLKNDDRASYLRLDRAEHAWLRARLRLNRSYLADSKFRCRWSTHLDPSSRYCGHCGPPARENPAHLLVCPVYQVPRSVLHQQLRELRLQPTLRVLLGEVDHLPRRVRRPALHATGVFLQRVAELRHDGL